MEKRVKVGGRELCMRYTVNALCAVEALAGGSLDSMMERQFSATRLLLWGGLTDRQPELTLEQVGELIGAHLKAGGNLEEIVNLCAEGLSEAGFFGRDAL